MFNLFYQHYQSRQNSDSKIELVKSYSPNSIILNKCHAVDFWRRKKTFINFVKRHEKNKVYFWSNVKVVKNTQPEIQILNGL